jgi:hypothetical protein
MSSFVQSSSNAAFKTPGCERGFLAPPTIDMVPESLSIVEQIRRVFQITEAYFVYNCLVTYPSPSFILPHTYKELLAPLEPAGLEHAERIKKSIRYCLNSEVFMWSSELKHYNIPLLMNTTKQALCVVAHHWDCHSITTRILLGLHEYLLEIPDLDFDPNPPPPFDPTVGFPLMRSSSGPPSGSDDYIYNGSYLVSLEKCLGYECGKYNWDTYKEEGGTSGFIRAFGRERLLPLLAPQVDQLVAQYKIHPIGQLADIINHLGAPHVHYQLNPPTIHEEATPDDKVMIDFWTPICSFMRNFDECMGSNMRSTLVSVVESIPALKSDSAHFLALEMMARLASASGKILNADESSLVASFIGTRLPDSAPELLLRPRHTMYTMKAIDTTATKTAALV